MKRRECPTCFLDMNELARKGWTDCPQCGQGLSKAHAKVVLKKRESARKKENATE